jgi:arylsulfatase A-like enzyme
LAIAPGFYVDAESLREVFAVKPLATFWTLVVAGSLAGAGEGLAFLALDRMGLLSWEVTRLPVGLPILWASVLSATVLFGLVGLVVAGLSTRLTPRGAESFTLSTAGSLLVFTWLAVPLSGRIHDAALLVFAVGLSVAAVRAWAARRGERTLVPNPLSLGGALAGVAALVAGIPFVVSALGSSDGRSPATCEAAGECRSVLIVVVDALRADHLSAYGYRRETSPNIDRLARDGVLYENAIATSAWTVPSHASLLSGLYPSQHGVTAVNEEGFADLDAPVLAEEFQSRGFRTGAVSANLTWFTRRTGFGRGFDVFDDIFHSVTDGASRTIWGRRIDRYVAQPLGYRDIPGRKLASEVTDRFLAWLEQDPSRPFLAVLNYFDVHDPYLPPSPNDTVFTGGSPNQGLINWRLGDSDPTLTPEQIEAEIAAYDGAIRYVDSQIGRLLQRLESLGISDAVDVVITSDHGEAFGERGLYLHAHSLYREVIHVPLIYRAGGSRGGTRVTDPVSIAWVPSTVFRAAFPRMEDPFPPPMLPGIHPESAEGDLPARASEARSAPIAQMAHQPWLPETYPIQRGALGSILSGRWHAIFHADGRHELFDWFADPDETNDLGATSAFTEVAEGLAQQFDRTASPAATRTPP